MKVCVEWWSALSAYADEALPPDERKRLEAHLEHCEACRAALMELQTLRQMLRSLPPNEPPPMLKARILSATVDQPTLTEKVALHWRQWVWRASLVGATAAVAFVVWQLAPRDVPEAVTAVMSQTQNKSSASVTSQARRVAVSSSRKTSASAKLSSQQPRRTALRTRLSAPSKPVAETEVRWSTVARAPIAPQPAPEGALQGEPVIEDDVPHIDVNSPPAGSDEQIAAQPQEAESTVVVKRFSIPAEILNQGTSGIESLREQVRLQNREQLSGEIKRKLQRKQVDVDVFTVRF